MLPAWEALDELGGHEGADGDAWAGHQMSVPEERNNHFFVTSMDEFLFDHLKAREI